MTAIFAKFKAIWMSELVRRYELEHGFQRDAVIEQQARQQPQLSQQVLLRGQLWAERLGLTQHLQRWHQLRRVIAISLSLLAVLIGLAQVQATLALPSPISLLFALVLLLGMNSVMLLLWLVLSLLQGGRRPASTQASGTSILRLSMWLMQRLGRRPQHQQYQTALWSVAQRNKMIAPGTAMLSHGYWLLVMLATWLFLFVSLSTNVYQFTWASTIWPAATVSSWAEVIGWGPSWWGVSAPSYADLGPASADATNQLAAGRWLLMCVFSYGIVPRLLFLLAAMLLLGWRAWRAQLDLQAPGMATVVQGLKPRAQAVVIDADTQPPTNSPVTVTMASSAQHQRMEPPQLTADSLTVSLDFELDHAWLAQQQTAASVGFYGVVASGLEKRRLLAHLHAHPPQQLWVRVNSELSPDRTTLKLLREMMAYVAHLEVLLITASEHASAEQQQRLQHWQQLLAQQEIPWRLV